MNKKAKIIVTALASGFLAIFLYIVLHEAGHCIVAVFCGADITKFSISGAHMAYSGGIFSPAAYALFHAAGMLLPVLLSLVFMLCYSANMQIVFYRIFSLFFSLIPFFSLVSWILVPILYSLEKAAEGDDVTKFMLTCALNPWIVCVAAILLILCGILLAWKKGSSKIIGMPVGTKPQWINKQYQCCGCLFQYDIRELLIDDILVFTTIDYGLNALLIKR